MGSPLKVKEFHFIACIERGRTLGGQGHKSEIWSREYAGDPPPPCFRRWRYKTHRGNLCTRRQPRIGGCVTRRWWLASLVGIRRG